MKAAIYTRQSLDRTGTGLAVARQLADCEKLCAARGWEIVARESDNDMSAYKGKTRPGYQRITGLMESRRADVVVVWAVDRLTRRLADLVELIKLCERTGVTVATVAGDLDLSTDAGRLVARILGSVAEGEVERKSTRQQRGNRQAAEDGRVRKGTPRPFGWLADRVTADPAEKAAIVDACRALLAGGTVSGVMRDWNRRGLRSHQAPFGPLPENPWSRTGVRQILLNPRNAGLAIYRGTEVGRGEWEALVPEETFRAVVEVLGENKQSTKGVTTMLGGIALCRCGNRMGGSRSARGHKAYRCIQHTRNGRPGPHAQVISAPVDDFIGWLVINHLLQSDAADLVAPEAREDATRLREEATAIRTRLARLGPLFALGQITEQDMINGRQEGEARLAEINADLADLGRESVLAPLIAARENVAEAWEDLSTDRRRSVVDALMVITLNPSGRGTRTFDPRKVISVTWK